MAISWKKKSIKIEKKFTEKNRAIDQNGSPYTVKLEWPVTKVNNKQTRKLHNIDD